MLFIHYRLQKKTNPGASIQHAVNTFIKKYDRNQETCYEISPPLQL